MALENILPKEDTMKKMILVLLTVCTIMAFAACTSFQVSGLEVATQPTTGDIVGIFYINVKIHKFFFFFSGTNIFNLTSGVTDPKIVNAIREEVTKWGGTKAINVKIEYKATFLDLLLNSITWYIYAPATAHVTGTVIR
jgi:hypothetical protein